MADIHSIAATIAVPVRTCDDCGVEYLDWWADEPLWDAVIACYEGSLCFDCFRYRCHQKGIVTFVGDSCARWPNIAQERAGIWRPTIAVAITFILVGLVIAGGVRFGWPLAVMVAVYAALVLKMVGVVMRDQAERAARRRGEIPAEGGGERDQ